ncbi:MAG TPA: hypothetical protein VHC49_03005 [Mycobacteriales bacterium]|nr:hypothetical protein [Mycobacteriales bacterium]
MTGARRMSPRELSTIVGVMALFVATGVGVILSSAVDASIAFGIGLVVAVIAYVVVAREKL